MIVVLLKSSTHSCKAVANRKLIFYGGGNLLTTVVKNTGFAWRKWNLTQCVLIENWELFCGATSVWCRWKDSERVGKTLCRQKLCRQ
jgi:hypothetical protein